MTPKTLDFRPSRYNHIMVVVLVIGSVMVVVVSSLICTSAYKTLAKVGKWYGMVVVVSSLICISAYKTPAKVGMWFWFGSGSAH